MPEFSEKSKARLSTCCQELQDVFNAVIREVDCTIICGFRNEEDQNKAFEQGFSKKKWPDGNHNKQPSLAVDVCPYPIDWKDEKRFKEFSEVVKCKAAELGISITWGGDWQDFVDFPHWEVKANG
jgi:peptidoglycan L-alanyl-D-glutamate endopeptidase CwlK